MHARGIGGGGSRPVPTAPTDALIARVDDVAKRWLLELLAAAPLAAAGRVPAADLAADAPGVCAAVVEALGSERRMESALAVAPDVSRLAGATDAAGTVAAADALRRAIWATAQEEVPADDHALLAALADRLAHVCARLAERAIAGQAAEAAAAGEEAGSAPPDAGEEAGLVAPRAPDAGEEPVVPLPPPAAGEPDGAPLWMGALERQIGAGGRFALLLMELDGADRLRVAVPADALGEALERVGRGVRRCIRRDDLLAHETDGRLWVIAPGAGRASASALARRVARAVEESAQLRGAPLTASIGAALFPDDAREPTDLAGEAEESLLAARAAGVRFSGDGDDPDEPLLGPRLVN